VIRRVATAAAGAGGQVLGAVFRVAGEIPHRDKPLHPRGRIVRAELRRHGLQPPSGVEFLDAVGTQDVLVRESRSVGLPPGLPDISGLALRVTEPDGTHADLLFATTGRGRVSRYVLTPSRTLYGRPMTTLLPYRSAAGRVLLGLREVRPGTLELACSVDGGDWRPFADLTISRTGADADVSFDPVLNVPPGLEQYDVVRRLREPAYRGARASRQ
jgi:hypothetical protein